MCPEIKSQVAEMLNLRLGHAPADERAWATEANSELLVLLPGPQAVSDGTTVG